MNRPALIALALSFLIYVLPVFNVHAGYMLWPVMFFGNLAEGGLLSLAALAGALILQGLAWLAFYVLVRGMRWWKLLLIGAVFPVLLIAVNFTFMYAVPAVVLIAPDWTEDVGQLEQVCFAPDVSIMQVNAGVSLSLERSNKAWVRHHNLTGAGILSMPGCKVDLVADFTKGKYNSVNVAGEVLFATYKQTYHVAKTGSKTPREVAPPTGTRNWYPLLTAGGGQLAWLERGPRGAQGRPHVIRVRDISGPGNEKTINLDLPIRSSLTLLEADPPHFTIASYSNEIMVADDTGKVIWGPISPPGVENAQWGFRRVGANGWVAWDGYREKGRHHLVWSLEGGQGEVIMPRGRKIESVAVSPDGRYIAYATEANSYFSAQGRLAVLRTADGGIIHRRRLPQFARLQLAFLGNGHLAVRNYEDGPKGTTVYSVTD